MQFHPQRLHGGDRREGFPLDALKSDAIHAFDFLRETGTLSASLTFFISHRIPDTDHLLGVAAQRQEARRRG